MSADIAENLWALVCSCLDSYWTFHLFPLLIFFKLVALCTEFNLFTTICFVLFMITVSPIFVITKWATLLVDIHCFWCGSKLVYLSFFSGLAALKTADIPQNLWSLVCSCLNSYWAFHLFPLLNFFKLVAFCTEFNLFTTHLFCSLHDNGFPLYLWSPSVLLCCWIFIVPDVVLNLVCLAIFSGLAGMMRADIAENLWSLVCSCLNSYWALILFSLLIFFQIGCFLHWIQSVYSYLFCSL